jgi:hypothetical protein
VLRLGELSVREVDIFEAVNFWVFIFYYNLLIFLLRYDIYNKIFDSSQVYKRAKVNCELRAEAASPTNIRSAMGPLIDLIRFSAMTKDEFNRVVGLSVFNSYLHAF